MCPIAAVAQINKESICNEKIFTVFYNVENLFDTINNPNTSDDEFLPKSEKWNTSRYFHKINQLSEVFSSIMNDKNSNKMPDIMGLCEVENKQVINDLLKLQPLGIHNFIQNVFKKP